MSSGPLPAEPWLVREPAWNPGLLAQTESVFALADGHLGLRGNFDEVEPNVIPGRTGPRPRSGSGPDRPARQHPPRVAHRAAGRGVVGRRRGLRRAAPASRRAGLGVAAARRHHPADLRIRHSGLRLLVHAGNETVWLRLRDGSDARLPVLLYGERVGVGPDEPVVCGVVALEPVLLEHRQPAGLTASPRHGVAGDVT